MNLRDQRKKYYVSVKKLVTFWEGGGLKSLEKILLDPNSIIEKDSWVEKIKHLIEKEKFQQIDYEIALVSNKFNINQHDEKKSTERARDRSSNSSNKSKENNTNSISGGPLNTGDPHDRLDTIRSE